MSIHVCLVSHQPIPNLVPLLLEHPGRAVFLVSPDMKRQAARLAAVLKPRGIHVRQVEIDPYDFAGVADRCESVIQESAGEDPVLNVTGGTKVSALAAFQVFFFNNRRIIYLDTANNRILELAPENRVHPVAENLVSIRDYLACYGMKMVSDGSPPPGHAERAPRLGELARLLVNNGKLLGRFNFAVGDCWNPGAEYANIELNRLGEGADELAAILVRCGVARPGSGLINIQGEADRFFCQGGWIEELVFLNVARMGLRGCRPAINVRLKWDEEGRKPMFNELDVVFTHANRLYIVSCKTSRVDRVEAAAGKEAIYELDSLSDKAGGLFGRAMLVSARRLSGYDRDRARRMGIAVCDGTDILRLEQCLRRWLA